VGSFGKHLKVEGRASASPAGWRSMGMSASVAGHQPHPWSTPAVEIALGAGSLDPQGPIAERITDLWWLLLCLGVIAYVLFAYFLGVGLFRRSDKDPVRDEQPPRESHPLIIGGGVVLPVIILAVVFAATVDATRDTSSDAPAGALMVEITGHQWWWEVRYPDTGVTTRNELHIPVGRPIEIQLSSADVIHSFWVPELGGKLDLLPDHTNVMVTQADKPGEHTTLCAEFCGLHHAEMILSVVAESPARFSLWLKGQRGGVVEAG
jgi:cytochrome c oxidase subunit II